MSWNKPPVPRVWEAIEVYLKFAYGGGTPPSAVRDRLASLRATGDADFWDSPVFERAEDAGGGGGGNSGGGGGGIKSPTRYALRLGNKVYPHMKLVIERSPDGRGHLFRADTHDKHIQPAANSRESRAFAELMKMNQKFAEEIEAEWTSRGISTFKQYLRDDLARRNAEQSNNAAPAESSSAAGPG